VTRHHIDQRHLFDAFDASAPIRQRVPPAGLRWCERCHGSGRLIDPEPRCCSECSGSKVAIEPEEREQYHGK